jgi:signal transduction histidine kinase/CheY-like chemotaxis protein
MTLPLLARERTLGAITLVTAESGRRYDAGDMRLADDLARRAALAIDNARLYRELTEADRRKDQFLAMLAHELRNPLAPVQSAVDVIRARNVADPVVRRAREVIERQVRHLAHLLDDLLDVARITEGKIELRRTRVDLGALVADAVSAHRALADARGHRVTVTLPTAPVQVEADPTRLTQIVANLLNNAAKYTPPGGRIAVVAAREGADAVVRVTDDGIGIPAETLPRIFDLFAQGPDSLARSEGGLGLGLTVVRRLVELHGGSVTARSEGPGKGSVFVVRLRPAAESPAPAHAEPRAAGSAAVPRHVLVVEDLDDAREMLRLTLELDGHRVTVAADGAAALEAVRASLPDVALVDIGLPGMDGYEVARRLRATAGARIRLVALTGYGQPDDRDRARQAGFDAHLVKPVDPDALARALQPD